MESNNKFTNSVSNIVDKATGLGKKAVSDISVGAKNLSDKTKKALEEQRRKKYNPLFSEDFFSECYRLPRIIKIVDETIRSNVDICDGAIGWTVRINDTDILHMYDSFVHNCDIVFIPYAKCDTVYCVDNFNSNVYVSLENIFERATNEKLAELEHIAYSLGAKSCSVEIVESSTNIKSSKLSGTLKSSNNSQKDDNSIALKNINENRGTNVSYFEGNTTPQEPNLKWFAYDDNIKNLISMRCCGNNSIKSKVLEFKGSASATMSQKTAVVIDALLNVKGNMSYERQAIREHSTKMIFAIEF